MKNTKLIKIVSLILIVFTVFAAYLSISESNNASASDEYYSPHLQTDSDGDGVPDELDECPDQAGSSEFGCPLDSDDDGVPDRQDDCPYVSGGGAPDGCPPDSDGDGILDFEDNCPEEPGPSANQGCPLVPGEETPEPTEPVTPEPTEEPALPALPDDDTCYLAANGYYDVNVRADSNLDAEVVGTLDPRNIYEANEVARDSEGIRWYFVPNIGGWAAGSVLRANDACAALTPGSGSSITLFDEPVDMSEALSDCPNILEDAKSLPAFIQFEIAHSNLDDPCQYAQNILEQVVFGDEQPQLSKENTDAILNECPGVLPALTGTMDRLYPVNANAWQILDDIMTPENACNLAQTLAQGKIPQSFMEALGDTTSSLMTPAPSHMLASYIRAPTFAAATKGQIDVAVSRCTNDTISPQRRQDLRDAIYQARFSAEVLALNPCEIVDIFLTLGTDLSPEMEAARNLYRNKCGYSKLETYKALQKISQMNLSVARMMLTARGRICMGPEFAARHAGVEDSPNRSPQLENCEVGLRNFSDELTLYQIWAILHSSDPCEAAKHYRDTGTIDTQNVPEPPSCISGPQDFSIQLADGTSIDENSTWRQKIAVLSRPQGQVCAEIDLPEANRDGDLEPDEADQCPSKFGLLENGCPADTSDNEPPTVDVYDQENNRVGELELEVAETVELRVEVNDPDNTMSELIMTLSNPDAAYANLHEDGTLIITGKGTGNHAKIFIEARDIPVSRGAFFEVDILNAATNRPPELTIPDLEPGYELVLDEGSRTTLVAEAYDPDGDPFAVRFGSSDLGVFEVVNVRTIGFTSDDKKIYYITVNTINPGVAQLTYTVDDFGRSGEAHTFDHYEVKSANVERPYPLTETIRAGAYQIPVGETVNVGFDQLPPSVRQAINDADPSAPLRSEPELHVSFEAQTYEADIVTVETGPKPGSGESPYNRYVKLTGANPGTTKIHIKWTRHGRGNRATGGSVLVEVQVVQRGKPQITRAVNLGSFRVAIDQTIEVGFDHRMLRDLRQDIRTTDDPGGGIFASFDPVFLTFQAGSEDSSIARVTETNAAVGVVSSTQNVMTITGVETGTTTAELKWQWRDEKDGDILETKTYQFDVVVVLEEENTPPSIEPIEDKVVRVGEQISFPLEVHEPDEGDSAGVSIIHDENGLDMRRIGTTVYVTGLKPGDYTYTIVASDARSKSTIRGRIVVIEQEESQTQALSLGTSGPSTSESTTLWSKVITKHPDIQELIEGNGNLNQFLDRYPDFEGVLNGNMSVDQFLRQNPDFVQGANVSKADGSGTAQSVDEVDQDTPHTSVEMPDAAMERESVSRVTRETEISTATLTGVFQVDSGQQTQIYLLRDGQTEPLFETSAENHYFPAVDPSGKWVAFLGEAQDDTVALHVYNLKGTASHKVLEDREIAMNAPTWSPDGQFVALTILQDGTPAVYTVEVGEITNAVAPELLVENASAPAYSPNGRLLAFERGKNIYVLSLNTSGEVRKITDQVDRACYSPVFGKDSLTMFFLCGESENQVLYRYDVEGLTEIEIDISSIHNLALGPGQGYIGFDDGETVYYGYDDGSNIKPMVQLEGKQASYMSWVQTRKHE